MTMMMTAAAQVADPSHVERVLGWAIRVLHAARQAPMSQLVLVLGALLAGICAALIGLVSGNLQYTHTRTHTHTHTYASQQNAVFGRF